MYVLCMYVCMYVFIMYVCIMHVCTYVCMYECILIVNGCWKLETGYNIPTLHLSRLLTNYNTHHSSSCALHCIFHFGSSLRITHKYSSVLVSSVPLPRACEILESSVCSDKRFWWLTVQH
jgi:hypothetical protein